MLSGSEMDGIRSCPMARFGIIGVEPIASTTHVVFIRIDCTGKNGAVRR
jgi:hypothetical protein